MFIAAYIFPTRNFPKLLENPRNFYNYTKIWNICTLMSICDIFILIVLKDWTRISFQNY